MLRRQRETGPQRCYIDKEELAIGSKWVSAADRGGSFFFHFPWAPPILSVTLELVAKETNLPLHAKSKVFALYKQWES